MKLEWENKIAAPDAAARAAAQARWDGLAKPLGSLGLLEEAGVRIAALTGCADVRIPVRRLLVFCADNGVVAQGVTQTDDSVTAAVAHALAAGESTVCAMARIADCAVVPIDVGMRGFAGASGILDRRIRSGTADITAGPAMTRAECLRAIQAGADLAADYKRAGVSILAAGEMGIGNTTTSSAVASVLLNRPPVQVTGRGAGLSDAGLSRKAAAIETAIRVNRPDVDDPVDVLHKVGGLDLAALCGLYLGCAQHRVPVLLDGFISAAAALCAVRICPAARCAMLASHVSAEPAGAMVLGALGLQPLITAGMRLGEGSGAVAALPLLDMALAVYHSSQTFGHLGIAPYVPQK